MDDLPDFDKLWDFQKPDETERKFRELLPRAEASGDRDYRLQLLTQVGRTLGLQGKFTEAHALLDEVEGNLTDELKVARVRYLLERGRAFNSSKDVDAARIAFLEAWDLARSCKADGFAVDAAHMMAIVEPPDEKLSWNLKGMELAEGSDDATARRWLGALYNNIGWDYHEQREYENALEVHRKGWAWHEEVGPGSRGARIAKWSVAKQLRCLGRLDDALSMQRELEAEGDGFVLEEIAECLHAKGEPEEARPYFERAHAELKEIGWVEKERLERLKRLSAAIR